LTDRILRNLKDSRYKITNFTLNQLLQLLQDTLTKNLSKSGFTRFQAYFTSRFDFLD